jgi:hypothetical protein
MGVRPSFVEENSSPARRAFAGAVNGTLTGRGKREGARSRGVSMRRTSDGEGQIGKARWRDLHRNAPRASGESGLFAQDAIRCALAGKRLHRRSEVESHHGDDSRSANL